MAESFNAVQRHCCSTVACHEYRQKHATNKNHEVWLKRVYFNICKHTIKIYREEQFIYINLRLY